MKHSLLFLVFTLFLGSAPIVLASEKVPIPKTGVYFGVTASDANGGFSNEITTEMINLLNKPVAILQVGWNDANNFGSLDPSCTSCILGVLKKMNVTFNAIPMLHINTPNRTLSEIATNTIHPNDTRPNYQTKPDDFFRGWARGLKVYGKPVLFRIFNEMNWNVQAPGFPWFVCDICVDPDTGEKITPALLIQAWRRVHDIFKAEGADNVSFMWILEPYYGSHKRPAVAYAPLYPGDAYVDWVGWDVYNMKHDNSFYSFKELIDADYEKMRQIAPTKPMIIPEFNSKVGSDTTGNMRAKWFTDMLTLDLPTKYPNIKAIGLFNVRCLPDHPCNPLVIRIQDEPGGEIVLRAFKTAIASSYYLPSTKPGDANGDTHVDEADYQIWLSNFGKTATGQSFGDFDNNDIVDGKDYVIWLTNYGT